MSSSILSPDQARMAQPMVWRPGHSTPTPLKEPAPAAVTAPPAPPPQPDHTELIAQLEKQWQARVREAQVAGFREGEAAGRARAAAEVQPVIERLSLAAGELAQMRPRLRKEAEADTVQLALAIARRVLRREMAVDPGALEGILLAALERLNGQEISRVRVHPSHASLVSSCLQRAAGGVAVEVVADPSRQPGDVIFETERGNLDASVESQLQEIERGLADRLRRQS
jgi:flagellar assembly protein FliH